MKTRYRIDFDVDCGINDVSRIKGNDVGYRHDIDSNPQPDNSSK